MPSSFLLMNHYTLFVFFKPLPPHELGLEFGIDLETKKPGLGLGLVGLGLGLVGLGLGLGLVGHGLGLGPRRVPASLTSLLKIIQDGLI